LGDEISKLIRISNSHQYMKISIGWEEHYDLRGKASYKLETSITKHNCSKMESDQLHKEIKTN